MASSYSVRISAVPHFIEAQSKPAQGLFTFAYTITVANEGTVGVQLIARHWDIEDATGQIETVDGLGVVGKERVANLPDLRTFAEQGLPDYSVFDWKALAGPKGIPADVVAFLNQEVNAILRDRATAAKFEGDGT